LKIALQLGLGSSPISTTAQPTIAAADAATATATVTATIANHIELGL
jgi:hypothetical protein